MTHGVYKPKSKPMSSRRNDDNEFVNSKSPKPAKHRRVAAGLILGEDTTQYRPQSTGNRRDGYVHM